MIGKQEWFRKRKFFGFGLYPKTKEGWIYTFSFIFLAIIIQFLPFSNIVKFILTSTLILIVLIDVIHIMSTMKKDEREMKHEAIANRNALLVILLVLIVGLIYQTANSALKGFTTEIDYFLIAALLAGVVINSFTNIYLNKKD